MDRERQHEHANYSLLASPGEMISRCFCSMDQERFAHPVQDKGFYTNSFHVDVDSRLPIVTKLSFEGPFHTLCSGGHISHVEISSALLGNTLAAEDVLQYAARHGVSYLGLNFPLDVCRDCGAVGTFDVCDGGPRDVLRVRRVSRYLEDIEYFTAGKRAEVTARLSNA